MNLSIKPKKKVGVVGAGLFGCVIANLLAKNCETYVFTQREESIKQINEGGEIKGIKIDQSIKVISDPQQFANTCTLIFPVVRSYAMRSKMRLLSPYINPDHVIIHGVKGFDISALDIASIDGSSKIDSNDIKTMSEVILEETITKRVGCFSGPNLAREIDKGQMAGTVLASTFDEVIKQGRKALSNRNFKVYSSSDVKGVELTGVLKNIIAIAAGALHGIGYGENSKAMLISRGLAELTWIGTILGCNPSSFLGMAGIGDLVATCSSQLSRNFTVGRMIASGKTLDEVLNEMSDVAEGVGTIRVINGLANKYGFHAPITQTLFKILFEEMPIEDGLSYLMHFPLNKDVDFISAQAPVAQ